MDPMLPDYDGACTSNVMRSLLEDPDGVPEWVPQRLDGVDQVVLLVLDGLGWHQMQERSSLLRGLSGMASTPIRTVAPTTTATALTSITTGQPPGEHGVIGYRMKRAKERTALQHGARHRHDPERLPSLHVNGPLRFETHVASHACTWGFSFGAGSSSPQCQV